MCLATPGKIVKIQGRKAVADFGEHKHEVDIALLKNAKVGDYLLAHGNLAIHKISKAEAKNMLKLIESCHHHGE